MHLHQKGGEILTRSAALTVVFTLLLDFGGGAFVDGRSGVVGRAAASGVFTEYAIPSPCTPGGITTGPDGALWFTEFRSEGEGSPTVFGTIGRVTTAGAFKEQTVSSARISQITRGPDGALWFTQDGKTGPKIGRISASGKYTEYSVPGAYNGIGGIASGPDGALWFTEASTDANTPAKIGRITTTGAVTGYTIPDAHSFPAFITAGPDGALWFTESTLRLDGRKVVDSGKIGRLTVRGRFTDFTLPTAFSGPEGITTGPDGALWFTEAVGKIGRITTSGALTEYKIPTGSSPYGAIVRGPDNALWFAEKTRGAPKLGRVTTAGAFSEYRIPTRRSSLVGGITRGPDGALWFTYGNTIGRLSTKRNR